MMKPHYRFMLMLLSALLFSVGGAIAQTLRGAGTEKDPYLIGTVDDWNAFRDKVQKGNGSVFAKMTADVGPVKTMIGSQNRPSYKFLGTFDGNGHTLTVDYETNQNCAAPFVFTYKATIINLRTTGTIKTSGKFAGGLIGNADYGNHIINNCESDVKIISTVNGDGSHGGFIGYINDDASVNITNCAFSGSIQGDSTTSCGGFIGWSDYSSSQRKTSTLTNCQMLGNFTCSSTNSKTFIRCNYNAKLDNCYYLNALGTPQGTAVTADELANGKYAWMLQNGDKAMHWGQTLNGKTKDKKPTFTSDSTRRVYQVSYKYANEKDNYAEQYVNEGTVGTLPQGLNGKTLTAGTKTFTASSYINTDTEVIITDNRKDLPVTVNDVKLKQGETMPVHFEGIPDDYDGMITCASSNNAVVTVDSTKLTVKGLGNATIKVYFSNSNIYKPDSLSFAVTVNRTTDITVNGEKICEALSKDWTYTDKELKFTGAGPFTLSGTDKSGNVCVTVASDCSVILDSLTLAEGYFNIAKDKKVTVRLKGNNSLTGSSYNAGLGVLENAQLTIEAAEEDGSLTANGGAYAAGIGQPMGRQTGSITINSGNIVATSRTYAAGIGGGRCDNSSFEDKGGLITINGGTIKATGKNGAGIGGGFYGKNHSIIINGGIIEAIGGYNVGIGGNLDSTSTTTINGGSVVAYSNDTQNRGKKYNGIGTSPWKWNKCKIIITGGSVYCPTGMQFTPTNGESHGNQNLYCMTLEGFNGNEKLDWGNQPQESAPYYNVKDILTTDKGNVYLWLPNGDYLFQIDNKKVGASVKDTATTAQVMISNQISIGELGWTTFCSPDELDFSQIPQITAYTVVGYVDDVVYIASVTHTAAGTPLLIKGTPGTYDIPSSILSSVHANLLKGSAWSPTTIKATDGDYANYYLSYGTEGIGFYRASVDGTRIPSGKAYLQVPLSAIGKGGTAKAAKAARRFLISEMGTTGISSVRSEEIGVRSGAVYSISGQKVAESTEGLKPGLYIVDGKKVVVK